MTTDRIRYPALLQYCNDDELDVVTGADDWERRCLAQSFIAGVQSGDRLIDSQGQVFLLGVTCGQVWLSTTVKPLSLQQVLALVRLHASQQGSCCVAKIGARTIGEAIHLVASLTD